MTANQATATNYGSAVADTAVATASRPSRLTGPQLLTDALIDNISRGHCGWTRKQLEILGVPWPAQSGWRQRLVAEGRSLTGGEVDALYAARKTKRTAEADPVEIPVLPCPWCSRPVQRIEQGGRIKEFCCKKHKNSYNAALNRLSLTYARTIRTPGSLRIWAAARVDPSPDGGDALPRTTEREGHHDTHSAALKPNVT